MPWRNTSAKNIVGRRFPALLWLRTLHMTSHVQSEFFSWFSAFAPFTPECSFREGEDKNQLSRFYSGSTVKSQAGVSGSQIKSCRTRSADLRTRPRSSPLSVMRSSSMFVYFQSISIR
eukprot:1193380-Prorocentrum_minimum.AAC.1